MALFTLDDFSDILIKVSQRGMSFVLSKFHLSSTHRTKSSFNTIQTNGAHWWTIPEVKMRWNELIYDDISLDYASYISDKFKQSKELSIISLGSGGCVRELEIAKKNPTWNITCVDFSEERLISAKTIAQENGLNNFQTINSNILSRDFSKDQYDMVMFNSSLHHFDQINTFIPRVMELIKPAGYLVIDEFVGPKRMQYSKEQLTAINECLKEVPKKYRGIFKTNYTKNYFRGSGLIRMLLSDPTECVDSASILPVIHSLLETIEEKPYGGNILMPVLKDISHNFYELDEEKKQCLKRLFDYEDKYLLSHQSDHVFGIYQRVI